MWTVAVVFGTTLGVLSSVATRLHLVGLLVSFGKFKTCRHRGGQIPSPHFTNKQVGAVGFELTTSWSQTRRATNCATPRWRAHDP